MAQLKGGVLGFGSVGQNLTTYINQQRPDAAQIVAACDVAQPQLDLARERYGLMTTPDAADLIAMDLDFVLVLSPNHAHADQVVMAAEAGKHIFCEKPISLSLDEADRMIAAVETAGIVNVVNYSMRYIDGYLKFKQMADEGRCSLDDNSVCNQRTLARCCSTPISTFSPHRLRISSKSLRDTEA